MIDWNGFSAFNRDLISIMSAWTITFMQIKNKFLSNWPTSNVADECELKTDFSVIVQNPPWNDQFFVRPLNAIIGLIKYWFNWPGIVKTIIWIHFLKIESFDALSERQQTITKTT